MGVDYNFFSAIADILPETVANANKEVADVAVERIKVHIIANGQVVTGEMLNSVHAEVQNDGSQQIVIDAKNEEGEYYAAYPNYGTADEPGNPFFEPALEDTQPALDSALMSIVGAMKKVTR